MLHADAREVSTTEGRTLYTRNIGKGRVVVVCGPVLEPADSGRVVARQSAYAFLCGLVGAPYIAPLGTLKSAPGFGTLALTTLHGDVTLATQFEDWGQIYIEFTTHGSFTPPLHSLANTPTTAGNTVNGAVAAVANLQAGETVEIPFLLT